MSDCRACSGTGIDWEAEFDRACLICGGTGSQEAADLYDEEEN